MGKLLGFITAGIVYFGMHADWWVAAIIGLIAAYIFRDQAATTKLIQVIDLETGQVTTQPNDKHAEKYLSTRENNS